MSVELENVPVTDSSYQMFFSAKDLEHGVEYLNIVITKFFMKWTGVQKNVYSILK